MILIAIFHGILPPPFQTDWVECYQTQRRLSLKALIYVESGLLAKYTIHLQKCPFDAFLSQNRIQLPSPTEMKLGRW